MIKMMRARLGYGLSWLLYALGHLAWLARCPYRIYDGLMTRSLSVQDRFGATGPWVAPSGDELTGSALSEEAGR
ncbi:hypothetical protein [Denitratimonas sp. CY0512]|uniref:hypothetical protein n=1 Tax=Denitratimonas sp. CY0512 TaxID=3131940 RepID=UPI0030959C82